MSVELIRRKLNVDEYYLMAEADILSHQERVELINGEIIRMSPIGVKHAYVVDRLMLLLIKKIGEKAVVRVQNPLRLDQHTEPEPDLVVLNGPNNTYAKRHPIPEDVIFLIEVAATTYEYDKEIKAGLYAKAGIPVYCLVNLDKEEIEVLEHPKNGVYTSISIKPLGDKLNIPSFHNDISCKDIFGK